MNVTIIGTGNMARAIGARVLAGGNALTIVGKETARARAVADGLADAGVVSTALIDDELAGDIFVLAVWFADAKAFAQQRADELANEVVIDITNPLNETWDGLAVAPDTSAAAELAGLAPLARIVKAFNMTTARPLTAGEVDGHVLDVLIAGDDDDAKQRVAELARGGGLRPIDVGDLSRARELEVAGLLNIRLQTILGTNFSNGFQLVGPR